MVKGRDLFDAVLWNDPVSAALFYTFQASLRNEVLKVADTTPVHKFIRTLAETGRLLPKRQMSAKELAHASMAAFFCRDDYCPYHHVGNGSFYHGA